MYKRQLLGLSTLTTGILQGLGRMKEPMIHSAIALVLHLILLAILMTVFKLNIYGVLYSNIFFGLIMCILNAISIKKYLRYRQELVQMCIRDRPESDLIAGSGGVIESIVTRKGVPQVQVGDRVKKGDLLVSSEIPIFNDEKEVTGYQYCGADADIFIRTVYEYQDEFPLIYEEKVYTGKEKRDVYKRQVLPYSGCN